MVLQFHSIASHRVFGSASCTLTHPMFGYLLQASSHFPTLRRALRSATAQPSAASPGPPPATPSTVDAAASPADVFPPLQVMQISQVEPVPSPGLESGSSSTISWPAVIAIAVAAMLCLCALLMLIYLRTHKRLRTSRAASLRIKSPLRTTKWASPRKWATPSNPTTPDPVASAVPSASSEPSLLVQKWLDTLTPTGANSSESAALAELPPPSPGASPVSPAVPQEALLGSRSDDKLQNSSQMHNNPIYDIRPLGNDNPVFVVDVRAAGSRSGLKASGGSSSEHLQLTPAVPPPRYTPCSSPGASMGAPRVGASSGADRAAGETLDLDNRRSSRSKPLWPLDSATRMPVKGASDDTTSLPLAHVRGRAPPPPPPSSAVARISHCWHARTTGECMTARKHRRCGKNADENPTRPTVNFQLHTRSTGFHELQCCDGYVYTAQPNTAAPASQVSA